MIALNKSFKVMCLALIISNCGGGSDSSDAETIIPFNQWQQNIFLPSSTFKDKCVATRNGINPATNLTFLDTEGTRLDENNFLRSFSDNTYLWYDEIVDQDPAPFDTRDYFMQLKTANDKFHFTIDTNEWYQLSQSGVAAGYGAEWLISNTRVFVAYTEPNSPATSSMVNLQRGDEVIRIDDTNISNLTNTQLNGLLFPNSGQTHIFSLKKNSSGDIKIVTMTSANITKTPVQKTRVINTDTGKVGYLLFNDHIATAEKGLFDAITLLQSKGINDLILDLRYNGGGFLAIANQLSYMIAGPTATAGKIFEKMVFNDKHPVTNPITGSTINGIPFYSSTIGLSSMNNNTPLPSLNLNNGSLGNNRVFVISGNDSCSASESIINSLIGLDIEVILIGAKTCGKPYGFYPADNCGTTYFTVQFKGINNKGFGDYADGFSPRTNASNMNMPRGCLIDDDLKYELGDINESRLAAALHFRNTNNCPSDATSLSEQSIERYSIDSMKIMKPQWLSNKIALVKYQ
jgi:carboxyl-terminal processing protease|tara:strand:- start:69045 stop:70598 length:1554 start_codon:yes stop_codon:yes gene_type:complete